MPVPRNPFTTRTRFAAALFAAMLMVPALMAGLSTTSALPLSAAEPTTDGSPVADRNFWVTDWLADLDRDGSLVDDRAEDLAAAHIAAGEHREPVDLLVTFDHWPTADDEGLLKALGGDVTYTFHRIPTVEVSVPAAAVSAVGTIPGVAAAEWNLPMVPMLNVGPAAVQAREFNGDGANALYNGETAEALGYTGEGMVIAVLDTGVRDSHAAFAGKWVAGAVTSAGTTECVNPEDEDGHGTHVAGIALANEDGSDFKGSAKDAKLVEVKISAGPGSLGGSNRGFQWAADYNEALDAGAPKCGVSTDDRIDVVTLSFGSTAAGGSNAGSAEALINDLVNMGVVVTIAVGNCGPQPSATCSRGYDENGISSPGNAAGAIGVANVRDKDTVDRADDDIAPSSSRGPNEGVSPEFLTDRYRKPELGAPGTAIMSANSLPPPFVQYYATSGTSMSTPMVAGVAALLLQAGARVAAETGGVNILAPRGTGYMGDGDHAFGEHPVRDALVAGADYKTAGVSPAQLDKWEGEGMLAATWNNAHGYGEVNTFASVCWAWKNILKPAGATPPSVVEAGCQLEARPLEVHANGPLWTPVDAPVSLEAGVLGGEAPYTFAWSVTATPDGATATVDNAAAARMDLTVDTMGVYVLEVTVTDAAADIATDTVVVTAYMPGPGVDQLLAAFDFDGADGCDRQGWASFQLIGISGGAPSGSSTGWHTEEFRPHTAPCQWYHGTAAGTYENNQNTYLISPGGADCFALPTGLESARFSFRTAGSLEVDFDYLHVEVSDCDADSWTELARFTGAHGTWGTEPATYERLDVDLSSRLGTAPFQLRLRVRTDIAVTDTGYQVDTFELVGKAPTANAAPTASITTTCEDLTCTFDGSASSDPEGEIISHIWTLGEGTVLVGETVTHTFAEGGLHAVALTVTDATGARDTATGDAAVRGFLRIDALTPKVVEGGTTTLVRFTGSDFWVESEVRFSDGPGATPTAVVVDADPIGTWMDVEVTVAANGPADMTAWDVHVVNPDNEKAKLKNGLFVHRA